MVNFDLKLKFNTKPIAWTKVWDQSWWCRPKCPKPKRPKVKKPLNQYAPRAKCFQTKMTLFLIIPMHMMNREVIWAGKRGFSGVFCKLTVADALFSSVKLLAALTWTEAYICGTVLAGAE